MRTGTGLFAMRRFVPLLVLLILTLLLAACDPMAVRPTPQVVVVTDTPTPEPTPEFPPTATPTRTPPPTLTPDVTPTPTPFPCEEDGQLLTVDDYRPEIARENLPYVVYVPPCYAQSTRRFPVLYLLHARDARQQQWPDIGLAATLDRGIRLGSLPPMIVVMPYYGNIGARNAFPPDTSYETVLLEQFIPAVQTDFCTIETREQRAIGGIDRGAWWAFSLAFRYPEEFSAAGAHSGDFDENVPAPVDPLEVARNSTLLPSANLRLYLDNAASDAGSRQQQTLSDRLAARQIPHTYIINPLGGRDNEYWSAHLSEYLTFYGETWARNYADLPSCLEPSP
jgi:enterochelin esterase-like enzyme